MTTAADTTVAILMALRNGGQMVDDQLRSFLWQTHPNWRLIASDDGSRDETAARLRRFARRNRNRDVALLDGPRRGFSQNFLHLIRAAGPEVPYAALSDQDDMWMPKKLARAIAAVGGVPSGRPALYCGRTLICDAILRPRRKSPLFCRPPGFRNALVQSIAGGNTMLLNRAALDLAQAASREPAEIVSHDWWLYQIVTGAGGNVIYDPEPMVLYRQHGRNLIGENQSAGARLHRAKETLRGRFRRWNEINIRALSHSGHRFTAANRALLGAFAEAREKSVAARLTQLHAAGLHRQTRAGNASFWCAATLGLV